jgi:hypothetical protein
MPTAFIASNFSANAGEVQEAEPNAGFARHPEMMKTGIQLPRMIVTSTHSESGCHEASMFFPREVRQLDLLGSELF